MTIDIKFMAGEQCVVSVNMCFFRLLDLLGELTEEEQEKWVPPLEDRDEKTFTDKEFIVAVWRACIIRGKILAHFDALETFIDTMVFKL